MKTIKHYYSKAKGNYLVPVPPEYSWTGKKVMPSFKREEEARTYALQVELAISKKEMAPKPERLRKVKEKPKSKFSEKQDKHRQWWRDLLCDVLQNHWRFQKDGNYSQKRAESIARMLGYPDPKTVTKKQLQAIRDERTLTKTVIKNGKPVDIPGVKAVTWNKELSAFKVAIDWALEEEETYGLQVFPPLPFAPFKLVKKQETRRVYIKGDLAELVIKRAYERSEDLGEFFEIIYDIASRRSEILYMEVHRIDLKENAFIFEDTKNSDDAVIPYSSNVVPIIERRLKKVEVRTSRKLFPHLTVGKIRTFWDNFREYVIDQGIVPKEYAQPYKFVPYGLRHGKATEIWEETGDIYTVKEILKHRSVTTSERYTHSSVKALKEKLKR